MHKLQLAKQVKKRFKSLIERFGVELIHAARDEIFKTI